MSEQLRTAAQAALEALEEIMGDYDLGCGRVQARALRAALAEPQPEPVPVVPREFRAALRKLVFMARTSGGTAGPDSGLMAALDEAERVLTLPYLNAAPQTQQPLTDEQILSFGPGDPDAKWADEDQLYFARAIEAAHGIGGKP